MKYCKFEIYLSISSGKYCCSIYLRSTTGREIAHTLGHLFFIPSLRFNDQPRYQPLVSLSDN